MHGVVLSFISPPPPRGGAVQAVEIFTEAMLYRVAQFYEDGTGWTKRHPAELMD